MPDPLPADMHQLYAHHSRHTKLQLQLRPQTKPFTISTADQNQQLTTLLLETNRYWQVTQM
jgi:hypothetical protein